MTIKEFYEAAADDAEVILAVSCIDNLDFSVDRTLFQRAVGNIVTNALAHTPSNGRVKICGEAHEVGVRVIVTDSGTGIDPEQLPYVFDRLFRGNNGWSATTGHGLGLSIVKTIVELHGGRITISSEPAQGTTVETWWPNTPRD